MYSLWWCGNSLITHRKDNDWSCKAWFSIHVWEHQYIDHVQNEYHIKWEYVRIYSRVECILPKLIDNVNQIFINYPVCFWCRYWYLVMKWSIQLDRNFLWEWQSVNSSDLKCSLSYAQTPFSIFRLNFSKLLLEHDSIV